MLMRHVVDALIVEFDGGAARRRKHMRRQLRRTDVLPHKAAAVLVDQDRAERGQTEPEPALAIHRDMAMTLIAVEERRRRAERLCPDDAGAIVVRAADVQRIGDLRRELLSIVRFAAKPPQASTVKGASMSCSLPRMRARTPRTTPSATSRPVTSASFIRTMLGIRPAAAASISKYSRPPSLGVPWSRGTLWPATGIF